MHKLNWCKSFEDAINEYDKNLCNIEEFYKNFILRKEKHKRGNRFIPIMQNIILRFIYLSIIF